MAASYSDDGALGGETIGDTHYDNDNLESGNFEGNFYGGDTYENYDNEDYDNEDYDSGDGGGGVNGSEFSDENGYGGGADSANSGSGGLGAGNGGGGANGGGGGGKAQGKDGPVSVVGELLDWVKHIVIAVVVGILFITFVGQRTVVYGMSMSPTLINGDQLVIEKISPKIGGIKRGDIVTIYIHGLLDEGKEYLIKRVIAVEGDTVRIEDGKVYLNGAPLEEGYIRGDYTYGERLTSEITIEKGKVFVMGDNRLRGGSNDSRSLGVFNTSAIRGKAIFRWYPFSKFGTLK